MKTYRIHIVEPDHQIRRDISVTNNETKHWADWVSILTSLVKGQQMLIEITEITLQTPDLLPE